MYTKALEIAHLLDKTASFINESIAKNLENTELFLAKSYVDDIVSNAYIIVAKIAGAEAVETGEQNVLLLSYN